MPTTRPRHTITETPPVHEALEELRLLLGDGQVDVAELVILGARAKSQQLREDGPEARRARRRLAAMIRGKSIQIDVAAADEVKTLRLRAPIDD